MTPSEFQSHTFAAFDKVRDEMKALVDSYYKCDKEIGIIKAKIALVAGLVGFGAGTLASIVGAVVVYFLKK